jgi:hypothetical protein
MSSVSLASLSPKSGSRDGHALRAAHAHYHGPMKRGPYRDYAGRQFGSWTVTVLDTHPGPQGSGAAGLFSLPLRVRRYEID